MKPVVVIFKFQPNGFSSIWTSEPSTLIPKKKVTKHHFYHCLTYLLPPVSKLHPIPSFSPWSHIPRGIFVRATFWHFVMVLGYSPYSFLHCLGPGSGGTTTWLVVPHAKYDTTLNAWTPKTRMKEEWTKMGDPNSNMCQGLNSHYWHIIGDGHQPNSRGLYTPYKDSLLKVGWPSPI